MIWLKSAWAAVAGARGTLTLILIAAVAAFGWARWSAVTRDRDVALSWILATCSTAGSRPENGRSGCLDRIGYLVEFERATLAETNRILAQVARDRDLKIAADLAATRNSAERTRAAILALEKADAEATDDRVGADWFGAVNDLAGLRAAQR